MVAEDGLLLKAVKQLSLSSNIILVDVSQVCVCVYIIIDTDD